MRQIETDYLVVGAGASGMAFVDALIANSDAEVVMVDRRHRPGGHWLDAYPFVRLHQPSANYGVNSRVLGEDRIDETGPNTGFYERATAAEICDYYNRVLEDLVASGRVRFYGMCDYRGRNNGEHHFVSRLSGEDTTVKIRRKFVDATYVESEIPSKHTPSFDVDPDVRFVPPNDLVGLDEPASGYTVIGAGKTSMDTCSWLLDLGVAPDKIRWIRKRDGWAMNRAFMQPLDLVGSFMQMQASWVRAAAQAETGADFARIVASDGAFVRLDENIEPEVFRGPILSELEIESLRRIENVVRRGRVLRIGTDQVTFEDGSIPSDPRQVYVDCTAAGFRPTVPRPIFEPGHITIQLVTLGIIPWSAATVGHVEATREDDTDKNRLCPPLTLTGDVADVLRPAYAGFTGLTLRGAEPDLAAWNEACRLNPGRGAADHLDDPRVLSSLETLGSQIGDALSNLERLVGSGAASSA